MLSPNHPSPVVATSSFLVYKTSKPQGFVSAQKPRRHQSGQTDNRTVASRTIGRKELSMPNTKLGAVIAHLRGLADRIMEAPSDLARIRSLIEEYADVDPCTRRLEGRVTPVRVNDVPCEWVLAGDSDPRSRLLYIHGGSWMSGSIEGYRPHANRLARVSGCAVLTIDYRLCPEHPFPEGLEDCDTVFEWLLSHGPDGASAATSSFVAGDSAGGNLTLALLLKRRDADRTLPQAAVALSPATDLTWQSPSIRERAARDPILRPDRIPLIVRAYLQGKAAPTDPYVSPLYGDFRGLPPLLLQTGEAEILYDDSIRLAEKARNDGVSVTLDLWPDMPHVFQVFAPYLPEATRALAVIGDFVAAARSRAEG
jgi:monoterpene epsilon-lactone hydrolase